MDILDEWLVETVERDLGQALEWRRLEGRQPPLESTIENRCIQDNGGVLRVEASKPGRVQICKWFGFGESPRATLSDGRSQIKATFCAVATESFEEKERRRLTENTLGGLLQLEKFEILATNTGPRPERISLSLHIIEFQGIGCYGAENFGRVAPYSIDSHQNIKQHLGALATLRKRESLSTRILPGPTMPSEASASSQPRHKSSSQEIEPASQTFATQAPVREYDTSRHAGAVPQRSEQRSSDSILKISAASMTATVPTEPSSTTKRNLPDSSTPQKTLANGSKSSSEQAKALLALLPQQNRVPILNPVRRAYPKSPVPPRVLDFVPKLTPEDEVPTTQKPTTELSESSTPVIGDESEESSRLIKVASEEPSVEVASTLSGRNKPLGHQHTSRSRISRKDVKIRKDQEKLLNDDNSWIPAEPGHRTPVANVPISILEFWNREADLRVSGPSTPDTHDAELTNTLPLISSQKQFSQSSSNKNQVQSDADIPWSDSPDRDQLPPDSSMESAVQSDHSSYHGSKLRAVASHPQKSMLVSATSKKTSSQRASSENEDSPIHINEAMLGSSSSSAVSMSNGEQSHGLICRAYGCTKSYTKASGLKKHIDRVHNDKPRLESFICNYQDCKKSYTRPEGLRAHVNRYHLVQPSSESGSVLEKPGISASSPTFPSKSPLLKESRLSITEIAVPEDGVFKAKAYQNIENSTRALVVEDDMDVRSQEHLHSAEDTMSACQSPQSQSLVKKTSLPVEIDQAVYIGDSTIDMKASPKRSRSASSESDIQTTIPRPLHEITDLHVNFATQQHFQSASSQSEMPFTQVKRTPYADSHGQRSAAPSWTLDSSPSEMQSSQPVDNTFEDITHVSTSLSSGHDEPSASIIAAPEVHNATHNTPNEQSRLREISACGVSSLAMLADTGTRLSKDNIQEQTLDEVPISDTKSSIKCGVCTGQTLPPQPAEENDQILSHVSESKRKAVETTAVSPNVSKRRKRFKLPSVMNLTEGPEVRSDPREGARRYRREYLESKRSSRSGTPRTSPNSPFAAGPHSIHESAREPKDDPPVTAQARAGGIECDKGSMVIDLEETEGILSASDTDSRSCRDPDTVASSNDLLQPLGRNMAPIDPGSDATSETTDRGVAYDQSDVHMQDADVILNASPCTYATIEDQTAHIGLNAIEGTSINNDNQSVRLSPSSLTAGTRIIEREDAISGAASLARSKDCSNFEGNISEVHDPACRITDSQVVSSSQSKRTPELLGRDHNSRAQSDFHSPHLDLIDETNREKQAISSTDTNNEPTYQNHNISHTIQKPTIPVATDGLVPRNRPEASSSVDDNIAISSLVPQNIYDRFRAAYPHYPADKKQFVAICRKISILQESKRMEHQFLWDDFIIRYKIDYSEYLRQCAEDADDPLPYEEYYRNEIEQPRYHSNIITRRNLDEALALIAHNPTMRKEQLGAARGEESRPVSQSEIHSTRQLKCPDTPIASQSGSSGVRVMIDLTKDDYISGPDSHRSWIGVAPSGDKRKKGQRYVPWQHSEIHKSITSTSNSHDVVPPVQWKASSRTSARRPRSQASYLRKSHSVDKTLDSELSGVAVSSGKLGVPSKSKEETDWGRKQKNKRDQMNRYEYTIRSAWGVNAHDVLPKQYVGTLGKRRLQQLAEIAQIVTVDNGRQLLLDCIHARIRRDSTPLMLEMTYDDLRAVQAFIRNDMLLQEKLARITSEVAYQPGHVGYGAERDVGMGRLDQSRRSPTAPGAEVQDKDADRKWWQDENSPFRTYARAYASVQPGQGNSYWQEEDKKAKKAEGVERVQKQIIDILGWRV